MPHVFILCNTWVCYTGIGCGCAPKLDDQIRLTTALGILLSDSGIAFDDAALVDAAR